jgi:hypothetical protein
MAGAHISLLKVDDELKELLGPAEIAYRVFSRCGSPRKPHGGPMGVCDLGGRAPAIAQTFHGARTETPN